MWRDIHSGRMSLDFYWRGWNNESSQEGGEKAMTKQIHVKLNYGALNDKDVATQGMAVVDGLTNNSRLTNPPIKPEDLKAQIEIYASLIAAAADGSKKAIAERKKQRAVVVKMLRQLGHWVE